jgi:hypothetical protein
MCVRDHVPPGILLLYAPGIRAQNIRESARVHASARAAEFGEPVSGPQQLHEMSRRLAELPDEAIFTIEETRTKPSIDRSNEKS